MLLLAVLIVAAVAALLFPAVSRVRNLAAAQQRYDLAAVREDLDWFNQQGRWMENIPAVRDGAMWLRLNSGQTEGLEAELAKYRDEKYRFWLFLLQLQSGKTDQAEATLGEIKGKSRHELGQALVRLFQGDGNQAGALLDSKPSGLNSHEQALWNLSRAQSDIMLGKLEDAGKAAQAAGSIEPQNPNVEMVQLRVALAKENLTRADQIAVHLQNGAWFTSDPEFWVQVGLLDLAENNAAGYTKTVAKLAALPQSGAYAAYLQGIQYLNAGRLEQGTAALETALESGLEGCLKADARQAVQQAKERMAAEGPISALKNE